MTTSRDAAELAGTIAELRKRLTQLERARALSNASIEATSIPTFDENGTLRQVIGLQPDGTFTTTDVNAPPPPAPSAPAVEERPGVLVVTWDGTFADGVAAPADFSHVEVHVSTTPVYTPTDETQVASLSSLMGGSVTLALDAVRWFVVLQAVNTSLVESLASEEASGTPAPVAGSGGVHTFRQDDAPTGLGPDDEGDLWFDTDDGNRLYRWSGTEWVALDVAPPPTEAPAASPTLTAQGLPEGIVVTASDVPDATEVDYYISATSGFAPGPTTLLASTQQLLLYVTTLPDGTALQPGTTYYLRSIAQNSVGAAAPSPEVSAARQLITTTDIEPFAITGGAISDFALTATKFHTLTHVIY